MHIFKYYLPVLFLIVNATVFAQQPDNIVRKYRMPVMTAKEVSILMKNDFPGMSAVADTNGYPSAQKALIYKKEIDLSPKQTADLRQIADALSLKEKEMIKFIIRNENTLDSLFRTNKLNDGLIIYYTNRFGLYQGELRNAILQAAYKTRRLLSPGQINKLQALKN